MERWSLAQDRALDLITLGRAGIDLNADRFNCPLEEVEHFTRTVGGSPANIAVGAAKLGLRVGFIGRVADNGFGRFIRNYFLEQGIDTTGLIFDDEGCSNCLAVTEVRSPEVCGSVFYRERVADLNLKPTDIDPAFVASAKVLLISGTALAASPSREAALLAAEYAAAAGTKVALDIDYRPYTWRSAEEAALYYGLLCEKCHIIIGTREEFDATETLFLPGNQDDDRTARRWLDKQAELVIVKRGKDGSAAYTRQGPPLHAGIYPARLKKTFGAGDAYAAALIFGLISGKPLNECMALGGACASIVISGTTCSTAMPTLEELVDYMRRCDSGEIRAK